MIKPTDRQQEYPGRVKLTPVAGQSGVYDMERADKPTNEGTPLNKATLQLMQGDIREFRMNEDTDSVDAGGTVFVRSGEAHVEYGPYGSSNEVVTAIKHGTNETLYVEWCIALSDTKTVLFYNNGTSMYVGVYDEDQQKIIAISERSYYVNKGTASTTVRKLGENRIVWTTSGTYPYICMTTFNDDWTAQNYVIKNTTKEQSIYNVEVVSDSKFRVFWGTYITDCKVDDGGVSFSGSDTNLGTWICRLSPNTTFEMCPAEGENWRIGASSNAGTVTTAVLSYSPENGYKCVCQGTSTETLLNTDYYWNAFGGVDSDRIMLIGWSKTSTSMPLTLYECVWNGTQFDTTEAVNFKVKGRSTLSICGDLTRGYVLTKNDAPVNGGQIFGITRKEGKWISTNLYSGYFGAGATLAFVSDCKVRTFSIGGSELQAAGKIVTGTWEISHGCIGPEVNTTSTHAIALNSAAPGEMVRCLFSGVADAEWANAGWKIDTEGVRGYSPADGFVAAQPYWWNVDDPDTISAQQGLTTAELDGIATQQAITDTELDTIATNQVYTDLELESLEQGQAQTELELMIVETAQTNKNSTVGGRNYTVVTLSPVLWGVLA